MKVSVRKHRLSYQVQSIIWTLFTCVMYKMLLSELAVLVGRNGVSMDVSVFKVVVVAGGSTCVIADYVFVVMLASLVFQGLGVVFAIREARAKSASENQ